MEFVPLLLSSILILEVMALDNESEHKEKNQPLPFHQRFAIQVNSDEAQELFRNRIINCIDSNFYQLQWCGSLNRDDRVNKVLARVAFRLGREYKADLALFEYCGEGFVDFLRLVEALVIGLRIYTSEASYLEHDIREALSISEADLGIEWKDGVFWPSGAKELDKALVNEQLQWLSSPAYNNVLTPFKKGLSHYLEARRQPERLSDIITDMYEALEALAKIVTERSTKDLSANAELFVSKLRLSKYYDKMLKDYITYANEYRHAVEQSRERVQPASQEVEAFVYMTGLFIRLAIERLDAE